MKRLLIVMLVIFIILIATFCKDDIISLDEKRDIKAPDKVQIITLDEKNRIVYLNFVFANIDQLDEYKGKELTSSRALSILDEDVYKKFPKEVQEKLEKINWTWNKESIPSSGIIAY